MARWKHVAAVCALSVSFLTGCEIESEIRDEVISDDWGGVYQDVRNNKKGTVEIEIEDDGDLTVTTYDGTGTLRTIVTGDLDWQRPGVYTTELTGDGSPDDALLYVDPAHEHIAFITDSFTVGAVQRDEDVSGGWYDPVGSWDIDDIEGSWSGQYFDGLDTEIDDQYPVSADIDDNGNIENGTVLTLCEFEGDIDTFVAPGITSMGVFNVSGESGGECEHGGRITAYVTPDQDFMAAWTCDDAGNDDTPEDLFDHDHCSLIAWSR